MWIKNKHIFMIVSSKTPKSPYIDADICVNREGTNYKLHDVFYRNLNKVDVSIYQGVLIPATFIPESFNGISPYLVIRNPLEDNEFESKCEIYFKKQSTYAINLISVIQNLLEENSLFGLTKMSKTKLTIQEVFIFLGRKIRPILYIPHDELDEELIERAESMVVDMNNNGLT